MLLLRVGLSLPSVYFAALGNSGRVGLINRCQQGCPKGIRSLSMLTSCDIQGASAGRIAQFLCRV